MHCGWVLYDGGPPNTQIHLAVWGPQPACLAAPNKQLQPNRIPLFDWIKLGMVHTLTMVNKNTGTVYQGHSIPFHLAVSFITSTPSILPSDYIQSKLFL